MWNIAVLLGLLSVTGYYAARHQEQLDLSQGRLVLAAADDMALYRSAVIDYFSQFDLRNTSVDLASLKAGQMLPAWSAGTGGAALPVWGNYRDGAGIIYIYATTLPVRNLSAALAQRSQNSVLAGVYRSALPTLQSPVFGDTQIPVTALAGRGVPDGAPVWIGMSK